MSSGNPRRIVGSASFDTMQEALQDQAAGALGKSFGRLNEEMVAQGWVDAHHGTPLRAFSVRSDVHSFVRPGGGGGTATTWEATASGQGGDT